MITRDITGDLLECSAEDPVVTVLGPHQSGKTTLVRMTFPDKPYFSRHHQELVARAASVVRRVELSPFFENVRKRVVKSPKVYFTDVGLAAFLLGIHAEEQAVRDPLRGNLYENLVIAEIVKGALNKGARPRRAGLTTNREWEA